MHIVGKTSVASAAVAMSLLCACGGGRHETTEKYFLVAANTKIAYWQEAAEGLRTAARELGVKVEMVGPETYDPKAEKEAFLAAVHGQIPPAGILVSAADPELMRSEEHTSELQSLRHLVCRLLLEKKKEKTSSCIHSASPAVEGVAALARHAV